MKKLLTVLVIAAMVVSASFSAFADELFSDSLVEKGDNYYYCEDGKPVTNRWIQDGDNRYYFGPSGRMYKDVISKIGDKYYAFDENGVMLRGFLDSDRAPVEGTDIEELFECTYLFDETDGSMYTGWYQADIANVPENYLEKEEIWFYFNPANGKKLAGANKKIDGNQYSFDSNGVMRSGWHTDPNTNEMSYYGADNSGVKFMNGWVKAPMPNDDVPEEDDEEEIVNTNSGDKYWFYFKNGKPKKSTVARIDGKYYLFAAAGNLRTGLFTADCKSVSGIKTELLSAVPSGTTYTNMITPDYFDGKSIFKFTTDGMIDDAESKSTFSDRSYALKYKKGGAALNGLKGSRLYINGILVKTDEDSEEKYSAVHGYEDKNYFVNSTGTIMKKGKYAKGGDYYYAVSQAGALGAFFEKDEAESFAKSQETEDVNVTYIN